MSASNSDIAKVISFPSANPSTSINTESEPKTVLSIVKIPEEPLESHSHREKNLVDEILENLTTAFHPAALCWFKKN